jgi:hypothetical protein
MNFLTEAFYRFLGIKTNPDGSGHYSGRTSFTLNAIETKWLKLFVVAYLTKIYPIFLIIFFYISRPFLAPLQQTFLLAIATLPFLFLERVILKGMVEDEYLNGSGGEDEVLAIDAPAALYPGGFFALLAVFFFRKSQIRKQQQLYVGEGFRSENKPFRMGSYGVFCEKHPGFSDNGETFFIRRSSFISRFFLPEMPRSVSETVYLNGLERTYKAQLTGTFLTIIFVTLSPLFFNALSKSVNPSEAFGWFLLYFVLILLLLNMLFLVYILIVQIDLLKGRANIAANKTAFVDLNNNSTE